MVAMVILVLLLGITVASLGVNQTATGDQQALEHARSVVSQARVAVRRELRYASLADSTLSVPVTGPGLPADAYLRVTFRRPARVEPDGTSTLGPDAVLEIRPPVPGTPGALLFTPDVATIEPQTVVGDLNGVCYFRFEFGDVVPAVGEQALLYRMVTPARLRDGRDIEVGSEVGELRINLQNGL